MEDALRAMDALEELEEGGEEDEDLIDSGAHLIPEEGAEEESPELEASPTRRQKIWRAAVSLFEEETEEAQETVLGPLLKGHLKTLLGGGAIMGAVKGMMVGIDSTYYNLFHNHLEWYHALIIYALAVGAGRTVIPMPGKPEGSKTYGAARKTKTFVTSPLIVLGLLYIFLRVFVK